MKVLLGGNAGAGMRGRLLGAFQKPLGKVSPPVFPKLMIHVLGGGLKECINQRGMMMLDLPVTQGQGIP